MNNLKSFLYDHFYQRDWTWNLKGRGHVIPSEEDFQNTLDSAAKILYAEDSDTGANTLEVGRLIIKKTPAGLDVYVLAGTIDAKDASTTDPKGEE